MGRLQEPTRVCPNMVPMIDIVSQLVIFFMLASTFISAEVDSTVQLPDLNHSIITQEPGGAQAKLVINMAADPANNKMLGNMTIGAVNLTQLAKAENKSEYALLGERLLTAKKKSAGGGLGVIIRADKRLAWNNIQRMFSTLAAAGIKDVRLSGPMKETK